MKPDNWNRFATGLLAILLCLCSFSMQKRSTVYGSSGSAFTTTAWAPSRFQAHFLCRHPMYR